MSGARVGAAATAAAAFARRARGGPIQGKWRHPHAGALVLLLLGVIIVSFLTSPSQHARSSGRFSMAAATTEASGGEDAIAVFVTAPSTEVARRIASVLVEKRLAACVNIVPGIESIYEWQGKIEYDNEVLMMVKSVRARLSQLTEAVIAAHPYDTPEVISTAITGGSSEYLSWLTQTVESRQ